MLIDLQTIKPGTALRIPFSTFDKDDGSTITMTSFAVADILIYKDGSTTERASTSGFTATTDFDAKTGKHILIIDLADNTTADFFAAGSEYLVGIDAVTVDAVTVGGWVARFRIGYAGAILDTTIATLASQTSFTLTVGPAEDDALNGMWCMLHDTASAVQAGWAIVLDYTGATKTVTLAAGTTFTVAAKDNISIMGPSPLQPVTAGRTLDVTAANKVNGVVLVDTATTITNLPAITAGWLTAAGIASDAITAAKIADGAIDAATFAANAITSTVLATDCIGAAQLAADCIGSSELAASAVTEIQSGLSTLTGSQAATAVWQDTTAGDFTVALSIGKSVLNGVSLGTGLTINAYTGNTPQTGDSYAIVNSGTHGNAAIKGYVDDIGVAGAGLTALGDARLANLDAAVSGRMATYTQPTGFLAATFPGTVASPTNITAGTITTCINLTNAPTSGDLTATMKTSVNTEVLDVLNVDTLIDGKTIKEAILYVAAICAGRVSGAGTGTEVFKGLDEATTRVTVTVDATGNRTDILYG